MSELLTEQISHDDLKTYIKAFYKYAKKALNIDRDPRIFFRRNQQNADNFIGKTGYYDPQKEEIHLFITDRHAKDIVRSFAHELIHHLQKLTGMTDQIDMSTTGKDPAYSLHDDLLRAMEAHAFKDGNLTFRDWTDKMKIGEITVIAERKLKPSEKEKLIGLEKKVSEKSFTKKYGKKKGKQIYYATLTKQAKKKKKSKTMKEEKTMKIKVSERHMEQEGMMKEADDETPELRLDRPVGGLRADSPDPDLHSSGLPPEREISSKEDRMQAKNDLRSDREARRIYKAAEDTIEKLVRYARDSKMSPEQFERMVNDLVERGTMEAGTAKRALTRGPQKSKFTDMSDMPDLSADEPLAESKKTPYPVLFEQRERLLKEAYQTREERVYAELVRRFIKK